MNLKFQTNLNDKQSKRFMFLHDEAFNADTEYSSHQHNWGQIICVKSGIFVLNVQGQRYLAPSGFALWIPPYTEHACYNQQLTRFRTINITDCQVMPNYTCLFGLNKISHAIIDSFFERNILEPESEQDLRLAQVLIDQLLVESNLTLYLPSSNDKYLAPILKELELNPANNKTLEQWAQTVFTTERTLARRCQQELGMSFRLWRQRLRFLYSISLLEQGKSIQDIAFSVGYTSVSAFITMFKNISGVTPDLYRSNTGFKKS
ncbi:AraC family transcriptional regulator [Gilliamella apicola]|uniref:AraC family transcriptional regulator n=1 Tax=Gilliamella apicola TaxID=1196095 RepID=A0A2V4E286_9GAMM|nr:helix-turn-helix transcriptional regulator [Gilliamella apicola]PXZ07322.1 AraC family transcriptional regulator [Gilliamella apicola]